MAKPTVKVVAAPKGFELSRELRAADEIDVVTAFAHWTGWSRIRASVLQSGARVRLLTGLSFVQTEPRVLKDWIGREVAATGAASYLWMNPKTFHPKVFVVSRGRGSFALVGSGNLSAGGLTNNVECFYYVKDARHVREIADWVTELIEGGDCIELTVPVIREYEKRWKLARPKQAEIKAIEADSLAASLHVQAATMRSWRRAVGVAKTFFRRDQGRAAAAHKKAAAKIRRLLKYPNFNFTKRDWEAFYEIWELGHLIPIWKHRVYKQRAKLIRGLRTLSDRSLPIAARVDALCDRSSPTYVDGLGINGVSKILASIEPTKWPVENKPVRDARASFGYEPPRGGTIGQKYAAFAELMQQFMKESGAKDMLALDAFFYRRALAQREK